MNRSILTRSSLVCSCIATVLLAVAPNNASAGGIVIANGGFAGNYVTLYDDDTDTTYSVWPGTNSLGAIAYDAEQDHVYFTTAFSVTDRLTRDTTPTDPATGLETVRDFGGGASDTFAFRGIDVASGSRVVYAWANGNGSSAPHARVAKVEVLDTATNSITTLFSGSDLNTDLRDVAVDSTSNWAYVSDSDQDRIFRVQTDGTTGPATVLSGLANPGAIDIFGSSLYWTEAEYVNNAWIGSIWQSDLTGGSATSLITTNYRINDIAVGDGRIYWTDTDRAPVNYRALSGGLVQTLGGNAAQGNLVTLAQVIPEPSAFIILSGLIACLASPVGGRSVRRLRRSD